MCDYCRYEIPNGTLFSELERHVRLKTKNGHLLLSDFLNGCLLLTPDQGEMCIHTTTITTDEGVEDYLVYSLKAKAFIQLSEMGCEVGEDQKLEKEGWIFLVKE